MKAKKIRDPSLNPKQRHLAELVGTPDGRSIIQKTKEAHVAEVTFYRWLDIPSFVEAIRAATDRFIGVTRQEAFATLRKNLEAKNERDQNTAAIALLKVSGDIAAGTRIDTRIVNVIETELAEVSDDDLEIMLDEQMALTNRLRGLPQGNGNDPGSNGDE